ncbi:hypothetical protein HF325_006282 [Metschnikowia pulcherrima]|uniref:DNA damage checkpoint control protein RAD17 n=1 Tax=Metschnikowia pulcherrima TaxID=27326 RepID=A0A8H7L7J7_9ASCO|nr:hypothetical protein HF325_006282 [Metschnikowia pulcherrima]
MSQLFMPLSQDNYELSLQGPQSPATQLQPQPEFLFAAATSQVSHLADVLTLISAIDRHALMIISQYGITFFLEYNHILNAQVSVDASLFSAFEYHWLGADLDGNFSENVPKNVQLGIDVHRLTDAFAAAAATVVPRLKKAASAAGVDTVLCYIKYRGDGFPLVVEFEDRLMSEQIEFSTFHLDIDFPYGDENPELQSQPDHSLTIDHSRLQFEVILQSDILANMLQDLQNLNTEDLFVFVSNKRGVSGPNHVNFVSKGAIGYLKLIFPSARTMLQKLEIYKDSEGEPVQTTDSILSTLGFLPFIRVFRAVKLLSKCKIMKDFNGVFLIQLLCRNTAAKSYPGTLIAFNMLEKSEIGGTGQTVDIDIDSLFDDQVYQVREYNDNPHEGATASREVQENQVFDSNEPFSYAAFRRRPSNSESESKRSRMEGETGATGSTETPLFL